MLHYPSAFSLRFKKNCCFSRSTSHRMWKHATVDVGVILYFDSEFSEFLRVLRYEILVELLYFGLLIHCWYEIILESIPLRMMMMILLDLSVLFVFIECCKFLINYPFIVLYIAIVSFNLIRLTSMFNVCSFSAVAIKLNKSSKSLTNRRQ